MDSPANTHSALLELPGELRNIIYRYVLVHRRYPFSGFSVRILPNEGFHEPSLLQVCKIIRADATSIYYNENIFLLRIYSMDSTPLVRWKTKVAALTRDRTRAPDVRTGNSGLPNWGNLKVWVERYRVGEVDVPYTVRKRAVRDVVLNTQLGIVDALFVMAMECGWLSEDAFERMLAPQRALLVGLESWWAH